uniref:Chitin-binding type-2 domain-containing protein n=1 Tax=Anisakis simplex TaxID=6269 RepID=A0A0M3KK05_ANISI
LGCSSEFAYCMNGKTEFEHCPDGLKFDPDRKQCLKTAHVKLCQGFTSVERKNSVGSGLYCKFSSYSFVFMRLLERCPAA